MQHPALGATRDAIDDWVDAVELFVEDRDDFAADNLVEMTRYLIDDHPLKLLLLALPE